MSYPPSQRCMWVISAPGPHQRILINFNPHFDLEDRECKWVTTKHTCAFFLFSLFALRCAVFRNPVQVRVHPESLCSDHEWVRCVWGRVCVCILWERFFFPRPPLFPSSLSPLLHVRLRHLASKSANKQSESDPFCGETEGWRNVSSLLFGFGKVRHFASLWCEVIRLWYWLDFFSFFLFAGPNSFSKIYQLGLVCEESEHQIPSQDTR